LGSLISLILKRQKTKTKYFKSAVWDSNLNFYFCTPFLTGVYNAFIW
jgi:hypothetical protein